MHFCPDEPADTESAGICDVLKKNGFDANKYFKDITEYKNYVTNLTIGDSLGGVTDALMESNGFLNFSNLQTVMTISDYNRLATAYGNETYTLGEGEYIVVCDYDSMRQIRNSALNADTVISINGISLRPKYDACVDGYMNMAMQHINDGIVVVPDNTVSATILALKELSESADNREKYSLFRKIGADEHMIDMALFKQIGIFFGLPLLLAWIHSIFGLKFIKILLEDIGYGSIAASV